MKKQASANIHERDGSFNSSRKVRRQIIQVTDKRQKDFCIPPQVIERGTSDAVVTRVIACIDSFIGIAITRRSQLFAYVNAVAPRININALRGYWFGCFLYYMWKCNSFKGNYNLPVIYGSAKLPLGLAKIFQQFAPFVDTLTGTEYKCAIESYNPNLFVDYPSVDMTGPTGDPRTVVTPPYQDLNAPLNQFLIAASNRGGTMPDYGAGLFVQATELSGAPVQTDWLSYVQDDTNDLQFRLFQTLFEATVCTDDIPRFAPDGSAYTIVYNTSIASPFPTFSKAMAYILADTRDDSIGSPDDAENCLYTKSVPVVRNYNRNLIATTIDSKISTLRSVYAYMTSYAQEWQPGKAKSLMLNAKELSGATRFQYERCEKSTFTFALLVNQMFRTSTWPGTDTETANKMFSLAQLCWSAFFQRLYPTGSLNHSDRENFGIYGTLYLPVSSCFYMSSMIVESTRFPATITRALAEIGPVVKDDSIVFPSFPQGQIINGACPTQPDGTQFDWSSSLQPTGIWFPNPPGYVFGIKMPAANVVPITYPGRVNAFTYTPPQPLLRGSTTLPTYFGVNPVLIQTVFGTFYTNNMPNEYTSERWTTYPKNVLGSSPGMFVKLYANIIDLPDPNWQNYYCKNYVQTTFYGAGSRICMPTEKLIESAIFGTNTLNDPSTVDDIVPLFYNFGPSFVDPLIPVQNAVNSSTSSQYQQFLMAGLKVQDDKATDYAVSNKILEEKVTELQSDAVNNVKPSYTMMHETLVSMLQAGIAFAQTELGRNIGTAVRRHAINFVTQGLNGNIQRAQNSYFQYVTDMNSLQ